MGETEVVIKSPMKQMKLLDALCKQYVRSREMAPHDSILSLIQVFVVAGPWKKGMVMMDRYIETKGLKIPIAALTLVSRQRYSAGVARDRRPPIGRMISSVAGFPARAKSGFENETNHPFTSSGGLSVKNKPTGPLRC
jgi:hypothetical protein